MALTIGEIAPGGDGVALVEHGGERRAVFVRGAAPGDRIEAHVDFRSRPARGHLLHVSESSADRETPACPDAMRCGGCNWMHLTTIAQNRLHLEHLRSALPAAWREHPMTVVPAAAPLGYRTRARIHVRASGGRAIVGMHAPSSHDPVEVDTCCVLHPAIERARREISAFFERAHGTGDVEIALGRKEEGAARPFVLSVRWSGPLPPEVYGRFERGLAPDGLGGVRIVCGEATRPSTIGDPTPWMKGSDGLPLRLAPGGFAQASEDGNIALARRVAELAESISIPGAAKIIELYSGAGNFTVLLARSSPHVVAVESNAEACQAARSNLQARSLEARIANADAATFALPKSSHLVVLDPPRTGARAIAEKLRTQPARFVLYVSCDLGTLGRDLQILSSAYTPRSIEAFELFPQTSHLETVLLLERNP